MKPKNKSGHFIFTLFICSFLIIIISENPETSLHAVKTIIRMYMLLKEISFSKHTKKSNKSELTNSNKECLNKHHNLRIVMFLFQSRI